MSSSSPAAWTVKLEPVSAEVEVGEALVEINGLAVMISDGTEATEVERVAYTRKHGTKKVSFEKQLKDSIGKAETACAALNESAVKAAAAKAAHERAIEEAMANPSAGVV